MEVSNAKLLNIIDIAVGQIPVISKRVTVWATPTTMHLNLYQDQIVQRGFDYYFEPEWQNWVTDLIAEIKTGRNNPVVLEKYKRLKQKVKDKGIDTIIFACTDLSAIQVDEKDGVTIVDSSRELAKEVISEYLKS